MLIHFYTTQGKRSYQEDTYIIKNYITSDNICSHTDNLNRLKVDLLGVFDGHGGGNISETISNILPPYFYKQNLCNDNTPKPTDKYNHYITTVFDHIQNELNSKHTKSSTQGSTVCLCIIYEFNNKKYVTSIWTGDSRAISCNQKLISESLTLDHKPNNLLERLRIESLGGHITCYKNDVSRVNGVLAVSRSLGDFDQKTYIEHKPDINHFICNYKFIVIATDGLWDVMDNQMVVDFIIEAIIFNQQILNSSRMRKCDNNIASKLADKAIELGSSDNITIIIYFIDSNYTDYQKYFCNYIK